MKRLITLLGLINGLYMLTDGIYVISYHKYIGPEKPGLWSRAFSNLDVNVFKLGPFFIIYGILWLIWVYAICTNQQWYNAFGIIICAITLWYLPIGTLFSLLILFILIIFKNKLKKL